MKIVFSVLTFIVLLSFSQADDKQKLTISPFTAVNSLVASFSNFQASPTGEISNRDDWILRRSDKLIAYERDRVTDSWEMNSAGEIVYRQVYHDYKTYIEYFPADFRLLEQAEPEWRQLGALFDLEALNTLVEVDRYQVSGQQVIVYTGDLKGLDTTVHWLGDLELPLRIEYQQPDHKQIIELQSLYGSQDSPWPEWQQSEYFGMDFVDMGDNESHPLVRALNAGQAGGGHQH